MATKAYIYGWIHVYFSPSGAHAGAQCMIGLLNDVSASHPLQSGKFTVYHFCLGQVLLEHTADHGGCSKQACLCFRSSGFGHYTYNYLPPSSVHSLTYLSPTMLMQC